MKNQNVKKASETVQLAQQLIACPSVTPNDTGCQTIITEQLQQLGFEIEQFSFGQTSNFWARRGTQSPLLLLVGHTDVVPAGPIEHWDSHPFQPQIRGDYLYGRGAVDMKGGLAAMLVACKRFVKQHPDHKGSMAWLVTSDEEGPGFDGTAKVVEALKARNEKIDYCLVGEPTSSDQLGDTVKVGRRGSLSGKLVIYGKQGHIAYPQLVENPIHKASIGLMELINATWDEGYELFEPTGFQISNIHAGTGANNIIPGEMKVEFNFRYSPAVTAEQLQQALVAILDKHQLHYELSWHHSGKPFLSNKRGVLVDACLAAIKEVTGITACLSTNGGTSDARFIAPLNAQIIELGPLNATAHQVNERISLQELETLTTIYEKLLINLFNT